MGTAWKTAALEACCNRTVLKIMVDQNAPAATKLRAAGPGDQHGELMSWILAISRPSPETLPIFNLGVGQPRGHDGDKSVYTGQYRE